MRHFPASNQFIAQRTFGSESELVLGRLTIDDELRSARILRSVVRTRAVAFFADYEEQSEISHAIVKKTLSRNQHAGDDAFGIACTASPDKFVVLARGDK